MDNPNPNNGKTSLKVANIVTDQSLTEKQSLPLRNTKTQNFSQSQQEKFHVV